MEFGFFIIYIFALIGFLFTAAVVLRIIFDRDIAPKKGDKNEW